MTGLSPRERAGRARASAPRSALAAIATLFAILVLTKSAAPAADFASALPALATENPVDLGKAVGELAATDDPKALPVLEALRDRRLRSGPGGSLWIADADGKVHSASGASDPAPADGDLKDLPLNNLVRRAVQGALARLQLRAPDAATRLAAVAEIVKRGSADTLPALTAALGAEKDSAVKAALTAAVAQAQLGSPDEKDRLRAVEAIRASGDLARKGDLEALLVKRDDTFAEPSEAVRNAARSALQGLEWKQAWVNAAANLFYGASLGSILLLAALGLGITFGLMGVINMAHGEMIMLGAYATYTIQRLFESYAPGALDWYLVAAVPTAFGACTLVGMLLERVLIRRLYGRPLETLLATWGTSLVLIQTVRLFYGAQNVEVANPSWLSGGIEVLHGVVLPYSRITIIGFVVVVVAALTLLLQRTSLGLSVRAVTQNRAMAAAMGIPTRRIDLWTFGLGSGLAGLGGVALSQLGNVGPELGQQYIVDCFMVVVIGGVGNIAGTVFAAVGLGVVNKLLEPLMGAVLGKIAVLVFIIVFIQRRPQGLFALKGRALET